MFKIGDFSRLCRVPTSALRYYADIGLLPPAYIDQFTGYRYYSLDQLPRLNRLLALKDLGLSLEKITALLEQDISIELLEEMLNTQEQELQARLAATQQQLERVRTRLRVLRHDDQQTRQEVVLKQIDAQFGLATRACFNTSADFEQRIYEGHELLLTRRFETISAPFAIFHDEELQDTEFDAEFVFPLAAKPRPTQQPINEQWAVRQITSISLAACTLHIGSYEHFPEAYATLAYWIGDNGYQINGQPREVYLRPPQHPDEVETAVTEIQYPVCLTN